MALVFQAKSHHDTKALIGKLTKRIDSGDSTAENYYKRAIEYRVLGQMEEAENDLKMALERNINFTVARRELTRILSKKGKHKLAITSAEKVIINAITQRDFIDQKELNKWNDNLIKIKLNEKLFREYKFQNFDNKLFQTRVFFPANSIPGNYVVTIYEIKNKVIKNQKNKVINIKKSGIGEKVYKFANNKPGTYGFLAIFFAIMSGLFAATVFRRL